MSVSNVLAFADPAREPCEGCLSKARMLQSAHEELEHERDVAQRFGRENKTVKAENRRLKGEQDAAAMNNPTVKATFEFWRLMTLHLGAKLGPQRARPIAARLAQGHTPQQCMWAVVGAAADAYTDPKGKTHDSIGLVFRSEEHIDDFIDRGRRAMADYPGGVPAFVKAVGDEALAAARVLARLQREQDRFSRQQAA